MCATVKFMRTIIFSLLLSKRRKIVFSSLFVALSIFFLLETSVHVQEILNNKLSWITKMPEVDLWVVDPKTESLFSSPLISREAVLKVRMLPEVRSASPLFVGALHMKDGDKALHLGIDETTLLGAPLELAKEKDKRGLLEKGFFLKAKEKFLYTSYRQATEQHPEIKKGSPFILIKLEEGKSTSVAIQKIEELTQCNVYSKKAFAHLIFRSLFEQQQFPTSFFSFIILLSSLILFLAIFFFLDAFSSECALLQTLGASFSTLLLSFIAITLIPTVCGYFLGLVSFGIKFIFSPSSVFPNSLVLALSLLFSLLLANGIAISRALKAQRRSL